LTCTSSCQLDTSSCLVAPTCGNSFIDDNEQCDGTNFGGISTSCASFSSSFESGSLVCDGSCQIDTSSCVERPNCGNSFLDSGEECDGLIFGSIDQCIDIGSYNGGNLGCTSDCRLDISGCIIDTTSCGDGFVNGEEQCDGSDLNGLSSDCVDFSSSFVGGLLSCTSGCLLSTVGCVESPTCGNGFIDSGETCDGGLFVGGSNSCSDYDVSFTSGLLACDGCQIDTSGCVEVPACGNGFLDVGEGCDGLIFGLVDECTDFTDFIGGDLDCTSTCLLDTSGCIDVPTCGNGVVDVIEDCDGLLFGVIDQCTDYFEFISGTLVCNSVTCQLDTTNCRERSDCGNGVVDVGELVGW